MLMGCVPVLIGDGVMQPFQPELDWSKFSVTVAEEDIPALPKLLGAVSKDAHATMLVRRPLLGTGSCNLQLMLLLRPMLCSTLPSLLCRSMEQH